MTSSSGLPSELQDLGAIIRRVQSRYIRAAAPTEIFAPLLTDLVAWTASEYGFLAQVLHDANDAPYLRLLVLTDITWDSATQALYQRHLRGGEGDALEFHNLDTLFGAAVTSAQTVICNDPAADDRSGGLPSGHPPLKAFLGVPLSHGGELIGVVGLANRPSGYDQALVDHLQPLFVSVAAIFGAVDADQARRANELALRRNEEHLRTTFDLAAVGIIETDLQGKPRMLNQRICDMLGRTREQQMRLDSHHVTHPDDRQAEAQRRRRLIEGESTQYRAEKRYLHAGGHAVWASISVSLVRKADGSPDYFINVVEDITERKRAEAELQTSKQRFVDLVNSVEGIFWEAEWQSDRFSYVSERAETITGFSVAQWLAPRFWASRVHPEDRGKVIASVAQAQEKKAGSTIEYRFIASDGRLIWMSSYLTVFHIEGARPLMRGLLIDITERKRIESAELAAATAQRANTAKTEFLSRMSHELRTPLNAVLGFAQLLSLDSAHPLNPAQQARVEHISQAGAHLLAMINDVLDFSRIESGGVALLPGTIPVHVVVNEAIAMVATAAAHAEVQIQIDRDAAAVSAATCVRADHLRLRQVLVNLLSNAIKYNRIGGRVTVRWPLDASNGMVRLQVQDTGKGMTQAQQDHLFEPFNRLGVERTGIEGTGIGLVITQRLVQLMGGEVTVHSAAGAGSTFTVALPVARAGAATGGDVQPAQPTDVKATPRYTVLYAEDNPTNVELVRQVLKMRPGCRLVVAVNGDQALRLARQEKPDLLLLDMHLGDISGLEVARQLHAELLLADCSCIALSADATPEQSRAALAAGFTAYLTKPLSVAQLLRCLDEEQVRRRQPDASKK